MGDLPAQPSRGLTPTQTERPFQPVTLPAAA